jgi:hypothetical protein
MNYLLDDQLAPVTHAWGFLEASLETVAAAFHAWHKRLSHYVEIERLSVPLAEALGRLDPLSLPRCRQLLLATDSAWTAYFDNSLMGGDPAPPVSYVAQLVGCQGLMVACRPDGRRGRSGTRVKKHSVQFSLYAPHGTDWLNVKRHVSVILDGDRWRFSATGSPQPFEQLERYTARRVVDRFPPELLESYSRALGIRLFDSAFYEPRAVLVAEDISRVARPRLMTLAEYRQKYGLG